MLVQLRDKVCSALISARFQHVVIAGSPPVCQTIIWLFFQESQKAPQKTCSLGDEFLIHNPLKVRKNKKSTVYDPGVALDTLLSGLDAADLSAENCLFTARDPALITSDGSPWKICVTLKTKLGVGFLRRFDVCQERKVQTAAAGSCPDISRETTLRGRAGQISIRWGF